MLTHKGIPLRRILPTIRGCYLIERIDRCTFHVPLSSIGTDEGVEEVLNTARKYPGQILECNQWAHQ